MTEDKRLLLKAISGLLGYPDAAWFEWLASLEVLLGELPPMQAKQDLLRLIGDLRNRSPMQLREEYTRVFDLNPSTCLQLSYHRWGDAKERAQALARLNQLYHDAGMAISGGELPDYLPLVLEFLTVCSEESFSLVMGEYRDQFAVLATRLETSGSVYAGVMRVLAEVSTRDEAEQEELARTESDGSRTHEGEDSTHGVG
jgi:nitrate reductase delta subunit